MGHYPKRKFDLVAITSEFVAEKLKEHPLGGRLCQFVPFSTLANEKLPKTVRGLQEGRILPHSQCWILSHITSSSQEWLMYPLAQDIVHLATNKFMTFASTMGYEMLAKASTTT